MTRQAILWGLLGVSMAAAVSMGCSSSNSGSPGGTDSGVSTNDAGDAGTNDAAQGDGGDNGAPSTTYPAYKPPVPQIGLVDGGAVMNAPQIRPIYFSGETLATDIEGALTSWFGSSTWTDQTTQYGIGAATIATHVMLSETPASTVADADIRTWLTAKLDGTHAEFGPLDAATLANEMFVLYYPLGTTITAFGATSCSSTNPLGGYWDDLTVSGNHVTYLVLPRCSAAVAALTETTSFLVLGAAGHPVPSVGGGFQFDADHSPWITETGGADLPLFCELAGNATLDGGAVVARSWSNTSMAGYHEPCVPAGADPYFVAAPVLNDAVHFQGQPTKGVIVPVGETRTIDVLMLSDGPTSGPWTVSVKGAQNAKGQAQFTLDRSTGVNGEKLHLTIAASAAGAVPFEVASTLDGKKHLWLGVVNQQ